MKYSPFLKRSVFSCLLLSFWVYKSFAQVASASPQNILRPVAPNIITIQLSGSIDAPNPFAAYSWTVSPSAGVSITHSSPFNPSTTAVFTSGASGLYTFTLTRGSTQATVNVTVGNLVACSNAGQDISLFNVVNGALASGSEPARMFDPFPDATSTAALGVTLNGYYYYMPNMINDGTVTLYAASPDGLTVAAVASIDLNGSSTNNLGFVRLAIDGTGKGWMLAGDGTIVYLASFVANGLNSTSIQLVDDNVGLVGGNATVFQNGDLCFSGSGAIYALANNGAGVTQIFTGNPNGQNTTLTKKWDLVDAAGNNFSGNVNGVAFDVLGSLYISAGGSAITGGLYYINQNTVNTATGTVQFSLVWSGPGLTDLASNYFPAQTTLPVRLLNFAGNYRSQQALLAWETEGEQNFSHFEIERSANGNSFISVGTKLAVGTAASRQTYQFTDDLSVVNGTAFTYRLKMVDRDSKFKYSNVIMIRRESMNITGIVINPNPVVNEMATVRFTVPASGNAELFVADLSGKLLWRQRNKVFEGNNSISLSGVSHLPAGTYLVKLVTENGSRSAKFIIAK
jgi:hypothetical protein